MADTDIQHRIGKLVDEEHRLRQRVQRGEIGAGDEAERLRRVETELDQCWDLLRQRRANREFHTDPGAARPRPVHEVENYQQ